MVRRKYYLNLIPSLYVILLVVTLILRYLGYSLTGKTPSVVFYVFFFVLSLISMKYLYKRRNPKVNRLVFIVGPLLPAFLLRDPILVVIILLSVISALPILLSIRLKWYLKDLSILYHVISIILCCLIIAANWFFSFLGTTVKISQNPSPSGLYQLVTVDYDQGIFGGDAVVNVEREFLGFIRWEKMIYIGKFGERPKVQWLDNSSAKINGRIINVLVEPKWDNRYTTNHIKVPDEK